MKAMMLAVGTLLALAVAYATVSPLVNATAQSLTHSAEMIEEVTSQ